MSTAAYYDGKAYGYLGNVRTANPYRKWRSGKGFQGLADQLTNADEWDRGWEVGCHMALEQSGLLVLKLNNFRDLVNGGKK